MTRMTMAELSALLAGNGLPSTTPIGIRLLEGTADAQTSTAYAISRVQVVRQLATPSAVAGGQHPEFVIEIIALKPPTSARTSAPYAIPDAAHR